jgi:hypothetical protein
MPSYDNPAGRLHELLRRLDDVDANASLVDAWAVVLGVEPDEVSLHLGEVGQLVADVRGAVSQLGESAFASMVARYREAWANPVFPGTHSFSSAVYKVRPDSAALEALDAIALHLHSVAPEGLVPAEAELGELKDDVSSLLDDIKQSSDLPDSVKHLLAVRLTDISRAIDHVGIGGPNAVRLATEALIGAIRIGAIDLREPGGSPPSETKRCVVAVLAAIWMAFTSGAKIQTSLEAWDGLIHGELNAGSSRQETQTGALSGSIGTDGGDSAN